MSADDVAVERERILSLVATALEWSQNERSGDPATSEWSRGWQNCLDSVRRNLGHLSDDFFALTKAYPGSSDAPRLPSDEDVSRAASAGRDSLREQVRALRDAMRGRFLSPYEEGRFDVYNDVLDLIDAQAKPAREPGT